MQVDGIFSLASQRAEWLSVRQKTVADNIAQANVPGYEARDTELFKSTLALNRSGLTLTSQNHLQSRNFHSGVRVIPTGRDGAGTVNVETELMKSIEIRSDYELNAAIVKAFHRMILASTKG